MLIPPAEVLSFTTSWWNVRLELDQLHPRKENLGAPTYLGVPGLLCGNPNVSVAAR